MSKLYKTKTEEWFLVEGNTGKIGLTDNAQSQLGDLVFIELPAVGTKVTCNKAFMNVESVKAVSEVFSPCCGTVVAVNEELEANPGAINQDAENVWIAEIQIDKLADGLTEL